MAQCLKILAAKPDNLCLIPVTCLLTYTRLMEHVYPHTQVSKQINNYKKVQ